MHDGAASQQSAVRVVICQEWNESRRHANWRANAPWTPGCQVTNQTGARLARVDQAKSCIGAPRSPEVPSPTFVCLQKPLLPPGSKNPRPGDGLGGAIETVLDVKPWSATPAVSPENHAGQSSEEGARRTEQLIFHRLLGRLGLKSTIRILLIILDGQFCVDDVATLLASFPLVVNFMSDGGLRFTP
jgi:hypothetical protein